MEDRFQGESLKTKLIIAGIAEIENHGLADFSLRRVANSCGASCAAPYRHFQSKSGFILEIIRYIDGQWALLENQLCEIYGNAPKRLLVELCVAYIRFGLANPDARAVLLLDKRNMDGEQKKALLRMTEKITALTAAQAKGLPEKQAEEKTFLVRSILLGAVFLTDSGEMENRDATIALVRESLARVIEM